MNADDRSAIADTITSLELGLDRLRAALEESTIAAEASVPTRVGHYFKRDRAAAILAALSDRDYPTTREWLELGEDVLSLVESGRGDDLVTVPGGGPAPASVLLTTLGLERLELRPPTSAERDIVARMVADSEARMRPEDAEAVERVRRAEEEEDRRPPVAIGDLVERVSNLTPESTAHRAIVGIVVRQARNELDTEPRWRVRWTSGAETNVREHRLRILATPADIAELRGITGDHGC